MSASPVHYFSNRCQFKWSFPWLNPSSTLYLQPYHLGSRLYPWHLALTFPLSLASGPLTFPSSLKIILPKDSSLLLSITLGARFKNLVSAKKDRISCKCTKNTYWGNNRQNNSGSPCVKRYCFRVWRICSWINNSM